MGNSVTDIAADAFAYCTSLETINLSESLVNIGERAFLNCTRIKTLAFPETLKVISESAFEECQRADEVTFGSNLELIGARAFYNCLSMKEIKIPKGDSAYILDFAFFGCESASSIMVGDGIISVGNSVFEGCGGAREAVIGDDVVTVGGRAFASCRKIYQVTIGKSVMTIGGAAFEKCWLIREVYNRSNNIVVQLGMESNGGLGYYAWFVRRGDEPTRISKDENGLVYYTDSAKKALIAVELTKNTDLYVPDDVTEIADYACYNEQLITSLVVGDGCVKIGGSAFRNSYKINSVVLGKNVTTVSGNAFRYNGYIVTIVIGKNLKSVGTEAFMKKEGDRYYKAYKTIFYEGTPEEWATISFREGNDHLLKDTVTLAFYSEEEPTSTGSYWHYVDGKPTLWDKI